MTNDAVSYHGIESGGKVFRDNDMLSATIAVLCKAKKLIILSDINGLYTADPGLYPDAKLIERIDLSVYSLAGGAGSKRGTGGMKTKLQAASLATANAIDTVITNGTSEAVYDIVKGDKAGSIHRKQRYSLAFQASL